MQKLDLQVLQVISEFDIIYRYFSRPAAGAVLGIGDDAALIKPAAGMELAVSTDMLVSGQHFFADADPRKLGHKSLAVNLSDMAAMGASRDGPPFRWHCPNQWCALMENGWKHSPMAFLGLLILIRWTSLAAILPRGPLNICVTIIGEVAKGKALRRSGARPGDDIWISGHLGDAALALAHEQRRIMLEPSEIAECLPALHTPTARVELGQRLIGIAAQRHRYFRWAAGGPGAYPEKLKSCCRHQNGRNKLLDLNEKISSPNAGNQVPAGGWRRL